jgi:hypothetical protein
LRNHDGEGYSENSGGETPPLRDFLVTAPSGNGAVSFITLAGVKEFT